jgi:hypothetical protein
MPDDTTTHITPSPDGASSANSTPAASSPSSSPASPPATPPDSSTGTGEAGGGEAFDFGAIFDAPPELPAAKVPAVEPPKAPTAPPVVEPPVTPAAPQQQATPPVAPAAPAAPQTPTTATAAPQAAQLDTFDPAALSQHLASNEASAVQFAAENVFKLSPEEVEALESNVIEAVPKLLAKVLVKSQLNTLSQMARVIPAMIQRQTEAVKQNTANETKFYGRWPDIKAEQHGDLVRKYAAVYRQMHPNVTLDQMVEDLGPMIMMAAKIVPQIGGAAPGQPAQAMTPAPANGRSPPPPPFTPAGAGATNSSRAVELTPIEAMFQDQG